MYISRRITLISFGMSPKKQDTNAKLQLFGNAVGLFNQRDKDKSCFRIFIQLLNAGRRNMGLSSDDIAVSLNLSRGTVIFHINKLMEAGLIIMDEGKYFLRVNNLELLVDEIEKDIERTIGDLREMAKEIDKDLGI